MLEKIVDAMEVELNLTVYINKENTKVLFAEVGNDFADVLISFLVLPLGKIVKVLRKHYGDNAPTVGSLNALYNSLTNPNIVDLCTQRGKQLLKFDNPIPEFRNLKISVDSTLPSAYRIGEPYNATFTRNSASFLISDDLRMAPNLTESLSQTLGVFGFDIADMRGAQARDVTFGLKEMVDLLKGSLISKTPLSDLVLNTRQTKLARIKSEPGIALHPADEEAAAASNAKKMILKVMFQKSTNKLLFAQAKDDFVDFLFSMLKVPLGRSVQFLGGNSSLANIDNLNWSLAHHVDHVFSKCRFTMPAVDFKLESLRNFLPLRDANSPMEVDTPIYVEGSGMYMVTDDLCVTRLTLSSILSLLHQMSISVSDVEEVELHIGLQEALSILKASLTSTSALTDGIINPNSQKQIIKILNQKHREGELDEKESLVLGKSSKIGYIHTPFLAYR